LVPGKEQVHPRSSAPVAQPLLHHSLAIICKWGSLNFAHISSSEVVKAQQKLIALLSAANEE
jgi:hypothetical protein